MALRVDEAHLVLNESFANATATLLSAGLEVVAVWQYGAQIQDDKIRGGLMSLLRQRCMFAVGEIDDARELSMLAMAAFTDSMRPDRGTHARLLFNAPHAAEPAQPSCGVLVDQRRGTGAGVCRADLSHGAR